MGVYAISGVLLLIALFLILRWFVSAEPRAVARVLIWIGSVVFIAGAVFLIATGRFFWVFYLLPALLPWLLRMRAVVRAGKNFSRMAGRERGETTGQASDLETKYLRMHLDHDTGTLWGEVIAGHYAGCNLRGMSIDGLRALLDECADDPPSVQVLETYLDRHHEGWRGKAGSTDDAGGGEAAFDRAAMSRAEALKILGLEDGATEDEIKAAHRRLMAALHPDHGGSGYLAAKINQARDILIGGARSSP